MIFPIKSESEMLTEILQDVRTQTGITNLNAGSIARSLVEIINKRLNTSYKYLDIYTSMAFLSTAEGMYLDMIGQLMGCQRETNEPDTNYRYRISQQVFTLAAANRTSIRLQCLALDKVRNVVITPYTRGNGSFTVHVITDEIDTPDDVLASVEAVVAVAKAEGIKAIVTKPTLVPIDITFNIVPKTGAVLNPLTVSSEIKQLMTNFIESISMGEVIPIYELISVAQKAANVSQVYITSLYIDNEAVIMKPEYIMDWDSRAYINNVISVI